MLRLGKMPDYGLVIAATFVGVEGLLTTNDVVKRSGVPLATVRKLLKCMVDDGLVASFRGNRGGYKLARPAPEISIVDVIQAIDGPISLTACTDTHADGRCHLELHCRLSRKWYELNSEFVGKLQSVSIAEIIS